MVPNYCIGEAEHLARLYRIWSLCFKRDISNFFKDGFFGPT